MGIVLGSSKPRPVLTGSKKNPDGTKKPDYYLRREGPSFKTLDFNNHYETRHVGATLWLSTTVKGSLQDALSDGVPKLKKYLKGDNAQYQHLPMTCPIRLKKIKESNMRGKVVVSMMVPSEWKDVPPATTSKDVYMQEEPKHIYFAAFYRKPVDEEMIHKEKKEVMDLLERRDESFEKGYHSIVIYDITCKQLSKVFYYEYWFFKELMENDYKITSPLEEGEEDDGEDDELME